jgi:hypothetical protein
MSIANIIYDMCWSVTPVSHLDQAYNLKSIELYKAELEQRKDSLYHEHTKILHYSQISYPELVFSKIGTSLTELCDLHPINATCSAGSAIGYTAIGLASIALPIPHAAHMQEYTTPTLPVSHLNGTVVKSEEAYRSDLEAKTRELYREHEQMIAHDQSSYTYLTCAKLGSTIHNLTHLEIGNALFNVSCAAGYAISGIGRTAASGAYNLAKAIGTYYDTVIAKEVATNSNMYNESAGNFTTDAPTEYVDFIPSTPDTSLIGIGATAALLSTLIQVS